jgi:hypothetical protein
MGASGLPAELLRYALRQEESRGTPAAARAHGCAELLVPRRHRASCLVVPHRRSDAGEPGNYRPTAMGELTMRLYAALLNERPSSVHGGGGPVRPVAGGLPVGHVHAAPRVHSAAPARMRAACGGRSPAAPLDSPGLTGCLQARATAADMAGAGAPGRARRYAANIRPLYAHAENATSVGGRRSAGVPLTRGVKQGCPLSPSLVGLLLDGLHCTCGRGRPTRAPPSPAAGGHRPWYTQTTCACWLKRPQISSAFRTSRTRTLQPSAQQSAAPKCALWCIATGPARGAPGPVWTCGGARLGCIAEYRYLGVVVSAAQGLATGLPTAPA